MIFAELSPPYSTIVADPPWHYDERVIEYGRGRAKLAPMPYSTMANDEIARMPVMEIAAPGAHLYLWTTNQHLWVARDICLGWGFDPVQVLVWCKPPAGLSPGGVFANTTEFVIYARRSVTAKRNVARAGRLIRSAREAAGYAKCFPRCSRLTGPTSHPRPQSSRTVRTRLGGHGLAARTRSSRQRSSTSSSRSAPAPTWSCSHASRASAGTPGATATRSERRRETP